MNRSPAARVADRMGRPNADLTLKCASSLPVRTAAWSVRRRTWSSRANWSSGSTSFSRVCCATADRARWSTSAGTARRPLSHVRKVSRGTHSSSANSRCPSPVARRRSRTSYKLRTRCHSRRRSPSDLRHVWPVISGSFAAERQSSEKRAGKLLRESPIANLWRCGANSRDRSLFSMKLRL